MVLYQDSRNFFTLDNPHDNDQSIHHGHEIRPSRISDSEPSAAVFTSFLS